MTNDAAQPSALQLLERGLGALAAADWDTLRSLCADDVVWHVPGHSPLAGSLTGPDAVLAQFSRMLRATASDRPAELVALLTGGDYAAAVQRNTLTADDGRVKPFTAVTLVRARDGRLVELQSFTSDQDAVDHLWSQRLPTGP